ncbi:Manganese-dependent ADP-ribose/CDP-alcohol diphosphatase [Striga hermonthica]|uniref:Manganese-dependent ADP-ribose/CDP-alcohol diphosphatase n=1 Tax=Striga hermonthica TaxID=68872 RepID=A0A9N7MYJ4_STRHE|nr:Manganese-dependent ADP-ribose/CDP-alcohol diphosphatase [Striga hermonthica]
MGYGNAVASTHTKQPLISFGVISDVQYADIPDGRSFLGVPRYYRHSLLVLQRAVRNWNEKKLKFAVNFGDIIDGFCPKDQSLDAITKILEEFRSFDGPTYHMIGNHCLYNLPREKLLPLLNIPSQDDGRAYYDFSPIPEFRFVVLDGYDISAIGWSKDHPNAIKAVNLLNEKNPNSDKNSPNGLVGPERRYLMFNGAVGPEQIEWLDYILQDATKLNQKVIICCHLPLEPRASTNDSLLWNYDEVMEVIHRYKCVKVCFGGHEHQGSYCVDSYGVHHRVLEAALECPPGTDAFGYVELFDDRLVLTGTDRMGSQEMVFV